MSAPASAQAPSAVVLIPLWGYLANWRKLFVIWTQPNG